MTTSTYPHLPVLIIDDEMQALNSFETVLRSARINHCLHCQDSREVIPLLAKQEIEVILLDLRMPHMSGEQLLPIITCEYPQIPVIIITAADDVDTAVDCMKSGAFDYLVKPVEKTRLIAGVKRAVEIRELERENRMLKSRVLSGEPEHPEAFSDIVTNSAAMRSVFQYVEAIAISPRPVMITGETGVGKEMIARAIHTLSKQSGDFVPVNLAGLDKTVFADTLFGHKKGAFTGADRPRSGLVEQAAGGTLFLDEIGDLDAELQVKLLRLLQEGEYFPLGSDVPKRSEARIVVATNKDIQVLQDACIFRKDLYYRLCGHHVHIPPLRKRLGDIPLLASYFLEKAALSLDKKTPTPPAELLNLLSSYHFPGNIRELQSMIWDAVTSHKSGKLSLTVFKAHIQQSQPETDADSTGSTQDDSRLISLSSRLPTLKQAEKVLISEALKRSGGNQAVAALNLGISRQALNRRLKRLKERNRADEH
jgi:DNA-binding NtrC family response regulator